MSISGSLWGVFARLSIGVAASVGVMAVAPLSVVSAPSFWTPVTTPAFPDEVRFLRAIACAGANCWAVGTSARADCRSSPCTPTGKNQPLIEQYNAYTGRFVRSQIIPYDDAASLSAVTCISETVCWAVGDATIAGRNEALVVAYEGIAWRAAAQGLSHPGFGAELNAVACVSAQTCWAVGDSTGLGLRSQALTEAFDGEHWVANASAQSSATVDKVLTGVSCIAADLCWAVGNESSGPGVAEALIERYDGSAWQVVASPQLAHHRIARLASVTCVTAHDCWAVGNEAADSGVAQALIERYDGKSWAVVAGAGADVPTDSILTSIACVGPTFCWAVGSAGPTHPKGLIERYDGQRWTMDDLSPVMRASLDSLEGVTCAHPDVCLAVTAHGTVLRYATGPVTPPTAGLPAVLFVFLGLAFIAVVGTVLALQKGTHRRRSHRRL